MLKTCPEYLLVRLLDGINQSLVSQRSGNDVKAMLFTCLNKVDIVRIEKSLDDLCEWVNGRVKRALVELEMAGVEFKNRSKNI